MERQEATNQDVRADITDLQGRTAEATIEAHKSGKVAQEAMAKAGQASAAAGAPAAAAPAAAAATASGAAACAGGSSLCRVSLLACECRGC